MFKVGDKVKVKSSGKIEGSRPNGYEGIITSITQADGPNGYIYYLDNGNGVYKCDIEINESNNMNLKEKFVAAFLSEPEKSFRKAGITNGDGLLTEDGRTVFNSWLLKKFGAEFKTEVVDELLKEDKA